MHYRTIIPAIDIMQGRCVRLLKGSYEQVTSYTKDPLAQLAAFTEAGAHRIHIVDLDAAFGKGDNRELFSAMRKASPAVLEVGGGVRNLKDITTLLNIGIDYVVIGSALVKSPEAVQSWTQQYAGRIIAGIDEKDKLVHIAGWQTKSSVRSEDLLQKVCSWGIKQIIFTNIERDGTLEGPDLARTNEIAGVAREHGAQVILSGGIASDADLSLIEKDGHEAIAGLITGKALYENRIDLKNLIAEQNKNTQPIVVRSLAEIPTKSTLLCVARGTEKSYKKTIEEGSLWVLHEQSGRVLPFAQEARLVNIESHTKWFSAWLSTESTVPTAAHGDASSQKDPSAILQNLWAVLKDRKAHPKDGSYTSYLFSEGELVIRKKLAEEAIEVALAQSSDELLSECGDLVYHLCVLLLEKGLEWDDLMHELEARHTR